MAVDRLTDTQFRHYLEAFNATENPAVYIAIDPGKSNGVCIYDIKFYLIMMLTIHADDMNQFLHGLVHIRKCIIEGYTLYPHKAKDQIYSDMETPRVIGRVEHWAETKDIELIIQPASIKPTAYLWLGQKPPKKSDPKNHVMDANAHFMHWAVKNKHIDARKLIK